VGPVAALAGEHAWRPPQPLGGLTVAVTRARSQASGLARRLQVLGARVVQAPVIRTVELAGPPLDPAPYDLICLTSPNGVAGLFDRLAAGGRDARALSGARVAAIGAGTAAALAEHGIRADVVAEGSIAESLAESLAGSTVRRALVARAREAREVLPDALRAGGAEVDVVELYETVAEPISPRGLAAARAADYITFTSSSTVRFFLGAVADAGGGPPLSPATRIVSIGPVTSATLRERGLEPHVEAERHDVEGVLAALLADAEGRDGGARA
jgi:uroporphyrinogen III methyltransferase/synthase